MGGRLSITASRDHFHWRISHGKFGNCCGALTLRQPSGGIIMLSWTITFLIVALIAALLGFTGIAGTAASIAKILFVIFIIMFLVSLISGRRRVE
jgi:uncharacterized membrane protein YtjA (UPF0391 family)